MKIIFASLSMLVAIAHASEEILKKDHYTLNYNEEYEVANWVSYELEKNDLQNCVKRSDKFKPDPQVSTGSATLRDYQDSGFDRGHLLPAGDMKFSAKAMSDTFYLSNITPQPAKFNRGKWSSLEYLIRAWAFNYNKVWIVTGPVLHKGLPIIGHDNHVAVPEQYFKVILRKEGSTYKGIAFLVETSLPHSDLSDYVTSINEVERLTGNDYFSFLDDRLEEEVESQMNKDDWNFTAKFEYLPCQASAAQSQKSY